MNEQEASNERLRKKYRPANVKVLFVGESQPKGPQFFYNGEKGMLVDHSRKSLPIGSMKRLKKPLQKTQRYIG